MLTDALLLPAISSVSTRNEMHPLAEQLADRLRSVATIPGALAAHEEYPAETAAAIRACLP